MPGGILAASGVVRAPTELASVPARTGAYISTLNGASRLDPIDALRYE